MWEWEEELISQDSKITESSGNGRMWNGDVPGISPRFRWSVLRLDRWIPLRRLEMKGTRREEYLQLAEVRRKGSETW